MKRSSQVALLLMGVTSAGASAYALLPSRDCAAPPAAVAPGSINPQALASDSSRRSSWGSRSYWSSRSYAYGSSSAQPSGRRSLFSPSTSHTSVPSVGHSGGSRGGFGSTGHSSGSHSSAS
jgi:hypothetical protein